MTLTQITTGGVDENINIDSNTLKVDGTNNRVGINTATPSAPLDVVGNDGIAIQRSSQANEFLIRPSSSSADGIRFTQAGGAGDRMVIDSSGRVAIGRSTANDKLHVAGNIRAAHDAGGRLVLEDSNQADGGTPFYLFASAGGALTFTSANRNATGGTTGSTERVRINSSGTALFTSNVAVNGSELGSRTLQLLDSGTDDAMIYGDNSGSLSIQGGASQPGSGVTFTGKSASSDPGTIKFFTNTANNNIASAERMRINSSGTLQIGGSANLGSQLLQVQGGSNSTADVIIANSVASVGQQAMLTLAPANNITGARIIATAEEDFSTGANRTARLEFFTRKDGALTERMRIQSNGRVGIGVSSPAASLHLSDSSHGIAAGYVGGTLPNSAGIYTSSNSAFGQTYGSLIVQARAEYSGYGISFRASNTERMRIASTGYLKVSDNGSYFNVGASYHEFNQSINAQNTIFRSTNSSYTASQVQFGVARAATSSYWFLQGVSGWGSGNDTEFYIRGDGNAFADGSWNGGGADYAEYFEWSDGNTEAEDRRGISVVLDADKIREAVEGEEPIGVISGNPSVVGDNDCDRWKNKYLRDDYGSYVLDEDGYRQLNPDYDSSVEYVQREDRPEWDTVGLMGKLRIRKGQITGSRWIKMRDVSSSVEEWLVR